jgi:hypothetical protein
MNKHVESSRLWTTTIGERLEQRPTIEERLEEVEEEDEGVGTRADLVTFFFFFLTFFFVRFYF